MTKKRYGKYPNAADFDPNIHHPLVDESTYYELPLADPSETSPFDAFKAWEVNSLDLLHPSAFSVNRKKLNKTS